jgi:hypothetical protein
LKALQNKEKAARKAGIQSSALVIPHGDRGPPEFLIFPFSNLLIFILFPTSSPLFISVSPILRFYISAQLPSSTKGKEK